MLWSSFASNILGHQSNGTFLGAFSSTTNNADTKNGKQDPTHDMSLSLWSHSHNFYCEGQYVHLKRKVTGWL